MIGQVSEQTLVSELHFMCIQFIRNTWSLFGHEENCKHFQRQPANAHLAPDNTLLHHTILKKGQYILTIVKCFQN